MSRGEGELVSPANTRRVGVQGFKSSTLILVPLLQFICCLALKICHRVCNRNTSVIARIIWIIDLQQWNCWSNCPFIWKITTRQEHIRPFYSVSSSKSAGVVSCWTANLCIWLLAVPLVIKYRRKRKSDWSLSIMVSWSGFLWSERANKYWVWSLRLNISLKVYTGQTCLCFIDLRDERRAGASALAETCCLKYGGLWGIGTCLSMPVLQPGVLGVLWHAEFSQLCFG